MFAHLKNDRFPRGEYNKLKIKKIEPCKILRNFSVNAYELELPTYMGISPMFNVAYLYVYRGDATEVPKDVQEKTRTWKK